MLKGTSHKPGEVIKTLDWPGGKREVTVERVATCAVMAGAKREYLPVILALANYIPFGNSTSSMANIIVVNGPIRDEIGMNYGTNVMGPHNEANSVIGRAYTLMSKTIGGLHSEKTTWSSLGSTMQYNNVCIAENEKALPEGWEPLHVQMGFKPNDSVITVGIGWTYISSVVMAVRDNPAHRVMADQMKALIMGSATVIMDPSVAALLKDSLGFKTKDQLVTWFAENVEKTQYPSGEKVKAFNQASGINIVVAGGGMPDNLVRNGFHAGPELICWDALHASTTGARAVISCSPQYKNKSAGGTHGAFTSLCSLRSNRPIYPDQTQAKLAASLISPLPLYFDTLG